MSPPRAHAVPRSDSRAARARVRPDTLVIAHAPRDRVRSMVRASVSRRAGHVVVTRTVAALERRVRSRLVDAVVVDLGATLGEPLRAAALAREFPSIAFVAMSPCRSTDAPSLARCAALRVADVLVDGVDDALLPHALATHGFAARFAAALAAPPPGLELTTGLKLAAWRSIVRRAGRPMPTQALARELGVTREHLSRSFGSGATPSLKRVIDLVRLLAAAELAKNPGYDVKDVARILGYSSAARLSSAAARLVRTRSSSLPALRGVDLIGRFALLSDSPACDKFHKLRPGRVRHPVRPHAPDS